MPVTEITSDLDAATMTVIADLAAPVERAWQLLADPRQLERWWGPPSYPATVGEHDLVPGGRVTYTMTGPEGDSHAGYWEVVAVEPPTLLEVVDGFAHADGTPNAELPTTRMRVELTPHGDGCRMTMTSFFASTEAMAQMMEMGVEQGIREAAGQMDALLAVTPA